MAKFFPHGSTVSFNGVQIGGVTGVSTPDESRGEVELTDHDSGGDREFMPGLRDSGTVTVEGRADPDDAGQDELRTNYGLAAATDVSKEVIITLPSNASPSGTVTFTFDGFVSQPPVFDLPGDSDDAASFSATIRVDGNVTKATA